MAFTLDLIARTLNSNDSLVTGKISHLFNF
jgi:hypothetical protein